MTNVLPEDALEKDIAMLAAIVQSSQDAIVSKTLEGIVTSWNPGAQKLFGYTAEEMIGESITKLILPENLHEEEMILNKIRNGQRVEHMQSIRRHKSGALLNISITVSPIKDSKGRIIGASKIARDVTEMVRAAKKLEESEDRLRLAIEAARLGTFEWSMTNDDFTGSERLNEIFGYKKQKNITHADLIHALHPEDRHIPEQALKDSKDSGDLNYEARTIWPNKSVHWVKVYGKLTYDEMNVPLKIYGTVMDITERKEDEIRKNQFLAVASHELKTPLTSVKAYAQLLNATYKRSDDTFLKNALSKLDSQVNKMNKLVGDFLNLSKIEVERLDLHPEVFEMEKLVKEVVSDIQLTVPTHSISVHSPEPVQVKADYEKISQVLINFLNNAVKYSPVEKQIEVIIKKEGDLAKIIVSDKGIGINSEEHGKIFERFYRSRFNDNIAFSGFGIGLYISSEIIRRHGGQIGVVSEFGAGSDFYFTLPAV